jgi:two-component system, cell cycle sensor histidine kinase and response regulator CckA
VVADQTHLLQVLLNLAGNAKDAMPTGGRLTLRLRADREAKEAIIDVTDGGTGIPDDVLPHIFEPFFTTKPSGQGTGLGLANVRQLVEGMNGTIAVSSRVREGSTFTIRIPTTTLALAVEAPTTTQPKVRGGTVLVVDDDVRVRAVVYTALERIGYRVLEAATPQAALELAQAQPTGVDLLLTDVVMGGGGGATVIDQIQRVFPNTRVLVMSGYNDDETLRRGVAQGAFPFIAKPFTAEALTGAVHRALST